MAQDKSQLTYILYQAWDIIAERPNLADLSENNPKKYRRYIDSLRDFRKLPYINAICIELRLDSFDDIVKHFPVSSIQDYIDILGHEEQRKTTEPVKEESSVPAELESMVAEYEDFKAKQKENDGKANSVADAVKRARDAMVIRERLAAIRRNRAALSDDPKAFDKEEDQRYERLITKICDPKAGNQSALLEPVDTILTEAVHSYIDQRTDLNSTQKAELSLLTGKIVENAQYLCLVGAINVSNSNDLLVGVEVALHLAAPQVNTPITLIYDQLAEQEKEIGNIKSQISSQEIKYSELQNRLNKATSHEEIQEVLNQIAQVESTISQLSGQIDSVPRLFDQSINNKANEIEKHLESQVDGTVNNNNVIKYIKNEQGTYVPATNPDGSPVIDRDFTDNLSSKAGKTISSIQEKLSDSGITPRLPPENDPLRATSEIEAAIRKEMPNVGLSLSASYAATEAAVLISDPKSQNPNLSSQSILLYGKGLSTKELDQVIDHAKAHPDSDLGRLLKANPDLFGNLRHQITEIEKTQTPEFIAKNNPNSAVGQLFTQNKAAFDAYFQLKKALNPKELAAFAKEHNLDPKFIGKLGKEFTKLKNTSLAKEIGKPIAGINKVTSGVTNRISSTLTKASSFFSKYSRYLNIALDPVGAARSWAGRQAAQFLFRRMASALGKDTAEFLLKGGLKKAVQDLAAKAAAKVAAKFAAKTAVKASLETAAQAANIAPGLGLVIALAIEVVWDLVEATFGLIKKGLNQLSIALYGEEWNLKTAVRDTATVVIGGVTTGAAAIGAFAIALLTTTAAAAASALGIIVLSVFLGYFFYITSLVVAPMISTLAQLESQRSASLQVTSECSWPVGPGYIVNQGPGGKASHYNPGYTEAIDISTPMNTAVFSATSGVVSYVGFSKEYLNTNIVVVESTLSNGKAFQVYYAHLLSTSVSVGSVVGVGTPIGQSGTAGTGPHLHFEYKHIKYNECPAGGIPLSENCPAPDYPGPVSCSSSPQVRTQ